MLLRAHSTVEESSVSCGQTYSSEVEQMKDRFRQRLGVRARVLMNSAGTITCEASVGQILIKGQITN